MPWQPLERRLERPQLGPQLRLRRLVQVLEQRSEVETTEEGDAQDPTGDRSANLGLAFRLGAPKPQPHPALPRRAGSPAVAASRSGERPERGESAARS